MRTLEFEHNGKAIGLGKKLEYVHNGFKAYLGRKLEFNGTHVYAKGANFGLNEEKAKKM